MAPPYASCTLMTNVFTLCVAAGIFTLHSLNINSTTTQILYVFMIFNEQQKVIEQEEKLIEHDINNVDNTENNMFNHQLQLEIIIATCFIIIITHFVLIATYFVTYYYLILHSKKHLIH